MLERETNGAQRHDSPAPAASAKEERSFAPVLALLAAARSRQRRLLRVTAGACCAAALLLAAPPLLALGSSHHAASRPLALLAVLGAVGVFLYLALFGARRALGEPAATARLLASRLESPTLRRGLLPAFELGLALSRGERSDFSPALARAHIESVATAARAADLSAALPDRSARRALKLLGAAAAVSVALFAVFSGPMSRGARFLLLGNQGPAAPARLAEPITGEIELTYVYPAYTRMPSRTVPNTNGEISAPPGTQVKLKTRADREVAKAFIVTGKTETPLAVEGKRELSGELLVSEVGSYRFRFESEHGRTIAEGPPIPIAIEIDAPPTVELLEPAADVEVDARSQLAVRYGAEDDYGLSEVALVFKLPGAGKPQRIALQRNPQTPPRASGDYAWDVVSLGLMAGDRVAYYVEATDNDEISGKKTGVSKTQYLKLYSEAEHHRQVIKQVEEKWEQLVTLLADRLESPDRSPEKTPETIASQAEADKRALRLAADLSELAVSLRKEKAPDALWRALVNVSNGLRQKASETSDARGELAVWLRRGVGASSAVARRLERALAQEIAEEERDVLYLESLLDQQRVEDLVSLAKELSAKRRELSGLLEKYRTAPDDETRDRLLSEIARLKERMAELMERMSELSRNIDDEHVNAEALKELSETGKMMSSFDKLQELLNEGKVEEAMKEMESLGQMLDDLERGLQEAANSSEGGQFAELGKKLGEFSRQLDQLERDQEQVLRETQQLRQGQKQESEKRLQQKGADFVERLRKKVAAAEREIGKVKGTDGFFGQNELREARSAISDLDKALAVKDFDQASQSAAKALNHTRALAEELERNAREASHFPAEWRAQAESVQKDSESARAAVPPIEEVQKELSTLFPKAAESMSEADRQKMKSLGERERQMQQKASEMREQMSQMNEEAPIFSPDAQEMMRQIGDRMGQAEGELRRRDPAGASGEQRAALDQLGQLKKGLQQGQQSGGGGQGPKVPWPWAGPGSSGQGDDSGMGSSSDQKVQVPGAEQYQVPEEFRKDILDAMKQGAPEKYKDQVKHYYEEIVR